MFALITVSFALVFVGLAGWTITTYIVKEDSQKFIKEELLNIFDICKMLTVSLKSLIRGLAKYSFKSDIGEITSTESEELDEQLLKLVEPVEPVEPVEEDIAMSSFSPELIEVIAEEEEKIA